MHCAQQGVLQSRLDDARKWAGIFRLTSPVRHSEPESIRACTLRHDHRWLWYLRSRGRYFLARSGLRVAVFERDRPAAGGTGHSAAIVRQHYSTSLMARLAKASMEIMRDAPRELGEDAGYRRVGYLFLTPPDAVEATRPNVAMQQALGIGTGMLEPAELASRFPWLNTDGVAAGAYEPGHLRKPRDLGE